MTALLTAIAVALGLFASLFLWCLGHIVRLPGGGIAPVDDVILAWWLAIAWIRAWLGGEIDSRNCREDI